MNYYRLFFQIKKWTLITLISLQAIGLIIYVCFSHLLLRLRVEASDAHTFEEEDAIRSEALAAILVISIAGVFIQLFGLGAVLWEQFVLVGAYGVLQLSLMVTVSVQAYTSEPVYWACAVGGMVILLLVGVVAVDLYRYDQVPEDGYFDD